MKSRHFAPHRTRGFTLVELMVALALGMLLAAAMVFVYINSKTAYSRQQQLGSLQQSVRVAFDYLSNDARMIGHLGCYSGLPLASPTFNQPPATGIADNFAIGLEGYEFLNTPAASAFALTSNAPADDDSAAHWASVAPTTLAALPMAAIAGAGTGIGLTPGSDVLIIRAAAGRPVRLASIANSPAGQTSIAIEGTSGTELCSDGTTKKAAGFCTATYGLIASCTQARVFRVDSVAPGAAPNPTTLTLSESLGSDPSYGVDATEVFPIQTIAYYVRKSSNGAGTSLYRRVFDGDHDLGLEQELIEGVESLQLRYGVDTSPTADGVVDAYVAAKGPIGGVGDSVTDWSRVVAIRMGLLLRSSLPVDADLAASMPLSGLVNGVTLTYPTTGPRYDRRVFTTTVAIRNRIAYFE